MTMSYARTTSLPDPGRRPAAYSGVAVKRALAWGIDTVAILLLTVLAVVMTGLVTVLLFPLLWFAVAFFYRSWSIAARSSTPGMRFLEIELRNAQGAPLTGAEAMAHTTIFLVASSMVLPQLASVALMLGTDRGQGLPDLALGTTAVNRAH